MEWGNTNKINYINWTVSITNFGTDVTLVKVDQDDTVSHWWPGVNFTNILWAAFAQKSFCQKITKPNCMHLKAVQRTLVWLLISTILYKQLFHTKVLCAPFMCLQFGFVIFWQKDFGAKAAHKMLVKLSSWVGFLKVFIALKKRLDIGPHSLQIFGRKEN